jgi:hypothetical protein
MFMLLNMVLREGWATRQVDYTNTFSQAEMSETVCVEPPKLFAPGGERDLVFKLLKSLYGLKQAPRTFYESSVKDFWSKASNNWPLILASS